MKRAMRIILSPVIFLVTFAGLTIIPFGFMALFMGLGMKVYLWLTNRSNTSDNPEWWFVFVWVVGPWYEAKKFINGEKLS